MARPRKRFGQHFLTDRHAIGMIVDALGVQSGEVVLEIGPGRGALTDQLAEKASTLVAVEIDRDLAASLRERYVGRSNVHIVSADVLASPLAPLARLHGEGNYTVVGNVPYYITTPILFHALQAPRPRVAVFLVQREVAERLAAPSDSEHYGALSVNAQVFAAIDIVARVPAGAFFPKPTVDSAVVRLTPHAASRIGEAEEDSFRRLVIALFGQRRRQLVRALRTAAALSADTAALVVERAALSSSVRPEAISPQDFVKLHDALSSLGPELMRPGVAAG